MTASDQPGDPLPRVVIDLEKLRHINCGLGRFALYLGQEIRSLAGGRFRPVFLLPRGGERHFVGGGFDSMFISPWRKEPFMRLIRPLAMRASPAAQIAAWHCTSQMSKYLPLDARIPVVLTVHDLTFLHESAPDGRGQEIDRRLRDLQQRVDRAAIVATDTDYVARELAHHVDLRGKGVHVLPLGPAPAPPSSPARPRFVPQGPFLFTLGNCLPHKNFHVLLDLVEARPEARLVLAGKKTTPYGEMLERQVASRGLRGRVVMPGEITDGDRQWLYEHCDAFLFPSLGEGFGLPVLEAMQSGKPVFVSRLTSLPELVADAGFYLDSFAGPAMAAAVEQGLGQWAADEAAPARARARAAAFSWRATAQGYAGLYRSLLGG